MALEHATTANAGLCAQWRDGFSAQWPAPRPRDASIFSFPFKRWAFSHLPELQPTRVSRGITRYRAAPRQWRRCPRAEREALATWPSPG